MGLEAHGLHTVFPRERVLEMLVLLVSEDEILVKATNTITRTRPLPFQLSFGGRTIDEGASTVLCISSCFYQINILHISDYRYNRTMGSNEESSRVINTPLISR